MAEEIAENLARGLTEEEARRQAYLKFGSIRRVREEVWRQNSPSFLDSLSRDISHAVRRLRRSPTLVLTVMVSLGVGIAANVFIFTAVNKLLLQTPPIGHPETLLDLHPTLEHGQRVGRLTSSMYDNLQEHVRSFSGIAAYDDFFRPRWRPWRAGTLVGPERDDEFLRRRRASDGHGPRLP